jgi:hypothetical protein
MTDVKTFPVHELKMDDTGYVELAFAQLDVVDKDGDVTLHGAFTPKDVPMSAYGHTSWDGALPVGKGRIGEEGDWAVFRGQMFMDTTAGRETHATLKGLGELAEFSYGYIATDFAYGQQDGRNVRFLKAIDTFEVSPVLVGAGLGTHLRALKGGAPDTEMPWAEHLSRFRDTSQAFLDHATARSAMRDAEGRKLSRSDRDGLREQRATLAAILAHLDELLVEPEDGKAAERARSTLLVEIERARALGVPI